MIWRRDNNRPGPEWLAAYADGELDRNPALASMKRQVEEWLATDPEARADVAAQLRLQQLGQQTSPAEPTLSAWAEARTRRESAPAPVLHARKHWRVAVAVLAATAAAVWLFFSLPSRQGPEPTAIPNPVEPFEVASADEVEILGVEGADTHSLVVGEWPLRGLLELLGPGEVNITSVEPAANDRMRPEVSDGPTVPMIWAHLDSER